MSMSAAFHKALVSGLLFGGFALVVACTESSHEEHDNHGPVPADTTSVPDDSYEPCINTVQVSDALPTVLSDTGLYSDIVAKATHSSIHSFKPRFQLWSDGADKARWVYLPECDPVIDTTDMNDWSLPVGTRLFKEFSLDGVRIETRLIERFGPGPRDFRYGTYLWNASEHEADLVPAEGIENAKGTAHDIPSEAACRQCHGNYALGGGRPSRALGFGAMQLDHDESDFNLEVAQVGGYLSTTPPDVTLPGDAATQAALGYLHVNCGVCHNDSVDGVPHTNLNLWWDVEHITVEQTGLYQTAVAQPTQIFKDQHVAARIVPGSPETSALFFRMGERGNNAQMPPVGSEVVDAEGLEIIRTWIESLP